MLEFQEGFFEQEVREGFYLDTTMKTVWAAELELLQKVAEVCDKYGLTWYAAYGTLLGAIRHEGFVPWDDDMDICLKRNDYNKLMKVLPKELPEGFLVKSCLTEVGYDQFHSCVCTGNCVSIAPEWLEQFHGCPFSVVIDIFPLDYLPRNEGDRVIQEKLLALAGRVAQLAKKMSREEYDKEDTETVQEVKEEIEEGIAYLKKDYKLPINSSLLEDEKWYELSSEMWKWGNVLAMMYSEEESDHLVEYVDYARWSHKVFPKEWFDEVYGAEFENFMLPVPAEYDKVLHTIYGDYWKCIPKIGQHDYPYYKGELQELREYVRNAEKKAEKAGILSYDSNTKDPMALPEEWLNLISNEDGTCKKIVLSANDPFVFVEQGEKALGRLEEILSYFEKIKDTVALWWRPHPVMKKMLDQADSGLGDRYRHILEHYKAAGWGICDETDNIDRAVETCDVYYGDMNAILQPFQNAGKTILLKEIDEESSRLSNETRMIETRTFPNFTDFVIQEDKLYFSINNYNGLAVVDRHDWTIEEIIPFEGAATTTMHLHLQCVEKQGKICFLPVGTGCAHVYDMESHKQKTYQFVESDDAPWESWAAHISDNQVYLLPCRLKQGLWKWNTENDTMEIEDWWQIASSKNFLLKHGDINEESFYTLYIATNQLSITNVSNKTIKSFLLPDEHIADISYDGQNFWYTIMENSDVMCWNMISESVKRFHLSADSSYGEMGYACYLAIYCVDGKVFLVPRSGKKLYLLDEEKEELRCIYTIELSKHFCTKDKVPHFKQIGKNLICMPNGVNELLVIDLESLDVKQYHEAFNLSVGAEKYHNNVLLERHPILSEERGTFDLDMLIQYCVARAGRTV